MAKMVTIGWFTEPWEAHIARGRLEAEGVRTFIANEHQVSANWCMAFALGCVQLQVLASDADTAREVLRRYQAGEFESELEQEFGELEREVCPACGSSSIETRSGAIGGLLALATLGACGVTFPPRRPISRCCECAYTWRPEEAA